MPVEQYSCDEKVLLINPESHMYIIFSYKKGYFKPDFVKGGMTFNLKLIFSESGFTDPEKKVTDINPKDFDFCIELYVKDKKMYENLEEVSRSEKNLEEVLSSAKHNEKDSKRKLTNLVRPAFKG